MPTKPGRPRKTASDVAAGIEGQGQALRRLNRFDAARLCTLLPPGAAFRADDRLQPRARRFLAAYAECGRVGRSAAAARIPNGEHARRLARDPLYAAEFARAEAAHVEVLEEEAESRARGQTLEPVFHQGAIVGWRRVWSDVLLIFLLKGKDPAQYGDKSEITHRGDLVILQPDVAGLDGRGAAAALAAGLAAGAEKSERRDPHERPKRGACGPRGGVEPGQPGDSPGPAGVRVRRRAR